MIRLSKTALESFKSCHRCFWLEKHGLKWPEGIKSGLPMGMDRILKGHFDVHRAKGVIPAEVVASELLPEGSRLFPDQAQLKRWRYWKTGPSSVVDGVEIGGALDELFVLGEGADAIYSMADYKSKAKETNAEDTRKYYQTQADVYDLLLNAVNCKTNGLAYFLYYAPESVKEHMGNSRQGMERVGMDWTCQVISIQANPDAARRLISDAASCLSGTIPESGADCERCAYVSARRGLDNQPDLV